MNHSTQGILLIVMHFSPGLSLCGKMPFCSDLGSLRTHRVLLMLQGRIEAHGAVVEVT